MSEVFILYRVRLMKVDNPNDKLQVQIRLKKYVGVYTYME
jgi:hypothetical protein